MSRDDPTWSLTDEVGGARRLREMMTAFYDRLFADPIIGFLFQGHDKERLVDRQVEYVRARLGNEDVDYGGTPIRQAHRELPITVGHFDRRHQILRELLREHDVPDEVREAWLELDSALRELVVRTGGEARDAHINQSTSDD
jgi:hemoglobin